MAKSKRVGVWDSQNLGGVSKQTIDRLVKNGNITKMFERGMWTVDPDEVAEALTRLDGGAQSERLPSRISNNSSVTGIDVRAFWLKKKLRGKSPSSKGGLYFRGVPTKTVFVEGPTVYIPVQVPGEKIRLMALAPKGARVSKEALALYSGT